MCYLDGKEINIWSFSSSWYSALKPWGGVECLLYVDEVTGSWGISS